MNESLEASLIAKTRSYLDAFSGADSKALTGLFSDDVTLTDATVCLSGRESVLIETINVSLSLQGLSLYVQNLFCVDWTVVAEIIISSNDREDIRVVDIIEFNSEQKISAIRAYTS